MQNKNVYDSKFISKSEIVGSHFINRYCNALYKTTCSYLMKNPSLTKEDAYRNSVYDYIKCIEKNINYSSEVDGILFYFQSTTKHETMTKDE